MATGRLLVPYVVFTGVRKGYPISRFVFDFFIEGIMKTVRLAEVEGSVILPYHSIKNHRVNIALLEESTHGTQQTLDRLVF